MPFVSKKQMKLCFALQRQNKNKSWNCQEWAEKTDYSKLPIYVPTKSRSKELRSLPPSLSKKSKRSRSRSKELRSLQPSLNRKSRSKSRSRRRSRY